jgi:hypothetical protein
VTSRRRRQASSRQVAGFDNRAVRRYFPVARHTRVERALGALLGVAAILVVVFLAWALLR